MIKKLVAIYDKVAPPITKDYSVVSNGETINIGTGRVYSGTVQVIYEDSSTKTFTSVDGGFRTSKSSVTQGDDSPTPKGTWKLTTEKSDRRGFIINAACFRKLLEVHSQLEPARGKRPGYYHIGSNGCVAMRAVNEADYKAFEADMAHTNAKRKEVWITIEYHVPAADQPHGNLGNPPELKPKAVHKAVPAKKH